MSWRLDGSSQIELEVSIGPVKSKDCFMSSVDNAACTGVNKFDFGTGHSYSTRRLEI
jgi:hypothetical protein